MRRSFSLRLTEAQKADLENLAKQSKLTLDGYIEAILKEELKRKQEKPRHDWPSGLAVVVGFLVGLGIDVIIHIVECLFECLFR